MEAYAEAVCRELDLRRDYLGCQRIHSVYFGGGTPTRLAIRLLGRICRSIYDSFEVDGDAEVTIEANPDDLCGEFADALRALPFNRLSIGVQSFDDALLAKARRRHTAVQAAEAFARARAAGFGNISIDLIYGFPGETLEMWESDVRQAVALRPEHVSAYALAFEPGTPLYREKAAGRVEETGEDLYLAMYELATGTLRGSGYEHYEISNFALPGHRAAHNSSYWNGTHYLGAGPGAHSYNGASRRRNLPDVMRYIEGNGCAPHESETLDDAAKYDEMVMTRLRTCEGIDLAALGSEFGRARLEYLMRNARRHIGAGLLEECGCGGRRMLRLTRRGVFVSDGVMSDLMAE